MIPRILNKCTLSTSRPFIKRFETIPIIYLAWMDHMNLVLCIFKYKELITDSLKTCDDLLSSNLIIFDILIGTECTIVVNKAVPYACTRAFEPWLTRTILFTYAADQFIGLIFLWREILVLLTIFKTERNKDIVLFSLMGWGVVWNNLWYSNTLRPRQNDRHFADDILSFK